MWPFSDEDGEIPQPVEPAGGQASSGDPLVRQYMLKKMGLDQDYQKAKETDASNKKVEAAGQFLAGIFGGGRNNDDFFNAQRAQSEKQVARADAARNDLMKEFTTQRQLKEWDAKDAEIADDRDPNSMRSQIARSVAMKFGGSKIIPTDKLSTMSAADINKHMPFLKDAYEADVAAQSRKDTLAATNAQRKLDQANKDRDYALREREFSQKQVKPADAKADNEVAYRYNALKQNAADLKALVGQHGTNVMFGPEGDQMDSKIYQMAVDYAKLVDPESIAREGEVAAAQKYMLPFRNWAGLGTSNSTATSQIDNYLTDLDKRLAAREKATGRAIAGADKSPVQSTIKDGSTAYAGPKMVKIKAPDGSIRMVPEQSKAKYLEKGGVEVE